MSDLWTFSSSSAPPISHHSTLSQSPPFISPAFSSLSPGHHGNRPQAQVPFYHLSPHAQVSSPHLSEPQVTSSQLLYQHQQTSPHCVSWSQVTSPHHSQPQITSSPLLPQEQAASPHFPPPYITSPHHAAQTSSHFLLEPQYHISNQVQDPGLDDPNWSRADPPSEPSSFSCQDQTTGHLDLHNQSQFGTHHRDGLENTHTFFAGGVYEQDDTPGPLQDTWRPLLSQLQCSPLGRVSGDVGPARWSSSPAEDSFHSNAPQPFCSPNTPGPSPHYPQTPAVSSPGPHVHPREERLDFHTQTPRQLSLDKTLSCCMQFDSFPPMTSEPHQSGQHLLQSHSELTQDQAGLLHTTGNSESCFSPQGRGQQVSSSAQPPGPPAGMSWREEGGGAAGGRGGGGAAQSDWTWVKQPQTKSRPEAPDCRLMCSVCKRDFRSLPALNGHMRSHSGSRSAGGASSPLAPPSVPLVMPVTVPVQSRHTARVCRGGQRRRAVLYRSLLHRDEEEDEGHYTPPPMLCPVRVGPGLYCSLTTRGRQRTQTVQIHSSHDDPVAMETAAPPPGTLRTGLSKPRINVGQGFQAQIPPLQDRKHAHSDSHNALRLWTPRDGLESPVSQQRVEALLMMARSSVVPGGGASPESALHVLSECRGDFLLTVEKLLSPPEVSNNLHPAQQSTRVSWSAAERRLMVKSLQLHHKDFSRVQRDVQTKSLSQCVEFYYLWKKKLSLSARTSAGLTVSLPDAHGQKSSKIT
uniref:transcriptional-regulating factor 1-like isoform X2 n=1 Tax=Scatophagus argus TaxID=75038 RepID=UPI001ED7D93C|nr:transcriptional-regulating factor 1-like isoform X2 [Scatophagus argus]